MNENLEALDFDAFLLVQAPRAPRVYLNYELSLNEKLEALDFDAFPISTGTINRLKSYK